MEGMLDVKARGGWAARSRQRCVGVHEPDPEENVVGTTPVVPERAQAEGITAENLEKYLDVNSRCERLGVSRKRTGKQDLNENINETGFLMMIL